MTVAGAAAAILAGGGATRMGGRAKSFLVVEGRRIIDRQLDVLRARFGEILISANDPGPYREFGLPVVPDAVPGQGPLGGILAVIEAARAGRVVCVACDMPYLASEAFDLLDGDEDVIVPVAGGRPEPLFASYARACAPAIRARLAAGDRKIARFFDDVRVKYVPVDPALRFLVNCNTPEDLGCA